MDKAQERFSIYLKQIESICTKAKLQENPAIWIFENDLRTPVFRLEGLARMYRKIFDAKIFEIIKEKTKQLEDALGKVDYYSAFSKELAKGEKIPSEVINFCKRNSQIALSDLATILEDDGWLNGKCVAEWNKKLNEVNWLSANIDKKEIEKSIQKEISKTIEFVTDLKFEFDNIEEDVHELRRKIRWISIYAISLNGAVQLKDNSQSNESLKKYLTKDIIDSPFNRMPNLPENVEPVYISKNDFFALSWLIAELGYIKDEGLRIEVIRDAIKEIEMVNDEIATQKAMQILGNKQSTMEELLSKATKISKEFFNAQILQNLIV